MEEAFTYGEVEPDQQRGPHGGGAIRLIPGCRDRALHPVQQAPLDVLPHEGVQPELAAEVVVERAGGDLRRRRQLADRHLVERPCPELLDRGQREPALRGGRYRNPLAHTNITLLC
jgi:hypothetical protein